jgi:hypothetical protein
MSAEQKAPTFDVRLDAGSGTSRDHLTVYRTWRVFITAARPVGVAEPDAWRYVLEVAEENGASVMVENGGMDLR